MDYFEFVVGWGFEYQPDYPLFPFHLEGRIFLQWWEGLIEMTKTLLPLAGVPSVLESPHGTKFDSLTSSFFAQKEWAAAQVLPFQVFVY